MTEFEIDRQIIMLFRQLTSDNKQTFLDFAKALNLEVAPSGLQDGQVITAAE